MRAAYSQDQPVLAGAACSLFGFVCVCARVLFLRQQAQHIIVVVGLLQKPKPNGVIFYTWSLHDPLTGGPRPQNNGNDPICVRVTETPGNTKEPNIMSLLARGNPSQSLGLPAGTPSDESQSPLAR